jgi:hypothetical protein
MFCTWVGNWRASSVRANLQSYREPIPALCEESVHLMYDFNSCFGKRTLIDPLQRSF